MEASLTQPPPDLPELPEGAEREPVWPPWFAWVGFLAAMFGTLVLVGTAAAIVGADDDSAGFIVIATLAQGIVFVGTAVWFASRVAPPKPWQFGLRSRPLLADAGMGRPGDGLLLRDQRDLLRRSCSRTPSRTSSRPWAATRARSGWSIAGLMVIAVAPVVEEIFFRGFFYRALRSRYPVLRRRSSTACSSGSSTSTSRAPTASCSCRRWPCSASSSAWSTRRPARCSR